MGLAWFDILAEAATDPVNLGILAQYGVLGLVAGGLFVFAKVSYRRETERADRLEAEVVRLNNLIIERVIPALTSAAQAVEEATALLRDVQREREMSMMHPNSSHPRRSRAGGDER